MTRFAAFLATLRTARLVLETAFFALDFTRETTLLALRVARLVAFLAAFLLPTTLRVVLVENLRRLAERVATNKAARELANLVCDQIENYSNASLDELLALLAQRGVSRTFLVQMAHRLQDHHATGLTRYHDWLMQTLPDLAAALERRLINS